MPKVSCMKSISSIRNKQKAKLDMNCDSVNLISSINATFYMYRISLIVYAIGVSIFDACSLYEHRLSSKYTSTYIESR